MLALYRFDRLSDRLGCFNRLSDHRISDRKFSGWLRQ